jgi:hypothetical protein
MLILSAILLASNSSPSEPSAPQKPQEKIFASPEPQKVLTGLFVFGDYLLWKADVTGLGLGITSSLEEVNNQSIPTHQSIKSVHFSYDSGFKIGAGDRFVPGWEVVSCWTRFHTSGASTLKKEHADDWLQTIWFQILEATSNLNITKIRADQSLKFDQLDILLMSRLHLRTDYLIGLYFGLRGAILNQSLHIRDQFLFSSGSGFHTVKLRNDFSGAGLKMGLENAYAPLKWFRIFGKASYSLLYGRFHLDRHDFFNEINADGSPSLAFSDDAKTREHEVVSALELMIGVRVSSFLANGKVELSGYIGYEFALWQNQVRLQNMLRLNLPGSQGYLSGNGNVDFQGMTLGMGLRF